MPLPLLQVGLTLGNPSLTPASAESAILFLVKLLFILAGLIYVVFAVIVVRQVHVMKQTLITSFSPVILLLGYIHLFVAIGMLVFFFGL